ncbi:predicted protein [Nematostella vectensis]|uniref:Uncharacterized protein n=1 Tax=Nematostella vectensis TaxID=45351 RepID=A7T4E5_NEMVE|nr:predicted protein [Nematostella vectensis]|eukprot:XP_001621270.1 hypothetical protein NEMVEDRAFT_v1g195753 [Nematostella vectensis]
MGRDSNQRDGYNRLNFLYQAACATIASNPRNTGLARFYASTMKTIGERLVLKLDPSIKRTVCKHCCALMVPGVTSKVRIRARRERHVVETCLSCGVVKRYLARKDYKLWSEQAQGPVDKATPAPIDRCSKNKESNESKKKGGKVEDPD